MLSSVLSDDCLMIFIFCNRKNEAKEYANPIRGSCDPQMLNSVPSDDFHFFANEKMKLSTTYLLATTY